MIAMKTTLQPFLDLPGATYKARILEPGQLPCPSEKGTILDFGEKTYWVTMETAASPPADQRLGETEFIPDFQFTSGR